MLTLVVALHNHQPVGNFDGVFRQALDDCYRPLLSEIARFPRLRFALHHSGPLLDWLEQHEASYLSDVVALARAGQIELLGGGFDEPILAAIPPRDALLQLRRMQEYWLAKAGIRPRGAWLAERVWDPALVPLFAASGLEFTFVDDALFHQAGHPAGPVSGRFQTERAGDALDLFAIDRELRYRIPFHPVPELERYLLELAARGATLTYADDGEKLGFWPGTREWVFERGWLRDFCTMLDEHREVIATALPSAVERCGAAGERVYPPAGAYEEMQIWALPTPARRALVAAREQAREACPGALPFVRGAVWEGFLAKYPESRHMHARMLDVSRRLAAAEERSPGAPALVAARRALHRAQCNCAYWHGLFGGLYLGHLRHAVFENLLRAEARIDELAPEPPDRAFGEGEALLRLSGPTLGAFIDPASGGSAVELDLKPRAFNLLNTLARWEEAYHRTDATSPGGEAAAPLVFDRRRRAAFLDHVLDLDTSFADLRAARERALATPADAPHRVVGRRADRIDLEWTGAVSGRRARLRKSFALREGGAELAVSLSWTLLDGAPLRVKLACEVNFTVLAGAAPDRYARIDGVREPTTTAAVAEAVRSACAVDEAFGYAMTITPVGSSPAALWRFPVETWTHSEDAAVRAYQGSAWYWVWDAELAAGRSVDLELRLSVAPSGSGRWSE